MKVGFYIPISKGLFLETRINFFEWRQFFVGNMEWTEAKF